MRCGAVDLIIPKKSMQRYASSTPRRTPGTEGIAQVRAVIYFFSSLFGVIPVYTEKYI